jgi:hypothetical protein
MYKGVGHKIQLLHRDLQLSIVLPLLFNPLLISHLEWSVGLCMWCDAEYFGRNFPTFRKNVPPLYVKLKSEPSKQDSTSQYIPLNNVTSHLRREWRHISNPVLRVLNNGLCEYLTSDKGKFICAQAYSSGASSHSSEASEFILFTSYKERLKIQPAVLSLQSNSPCCCTMAADTFVTP